MMAPTSESSEPFPSSSGAVSEHIAARRLGVSLDMLRRDRRTGKLGIPFIKIGEGKRGLVRYDLADLERWVSQRKRVGRALAAQARPLVNEPAVSELPGIQPEPPVAPELEPELPVSIPEISAPSRRSPPRTMWEALAETVLAEPEEEEPFPADRAAPRRQGSGYWGH